jgi:hypothetical protein
MTTLAQLLSVEGQTKSSSNEQITAQYQLLQKEPLLNGVARTYQPLEDAGERLPSEGNQVQVRVKEVLREVARVMTPLYDLTIQKDSANQSTRADVEIDGKVLLKDAPATYLLWLEKQLTDLHTVIVKLPVLPQTESWELDSAQAAYRTAVVETSRTKKIPRPFELSPATKEHPAKVELVHEDKIVGYWSTVKYSGAIPRQQAQDLRERIEKLQAAVKFAREKANMITVPKVEAGNAIFGYLFSDL